MATIPVGNFGQAVARPGPVGRVLQGDPVGQAMSRAGEVGMQIAGDMATQDRQEQQRLQHEQQQRQRAQAALTLARTNNDLHDAHDEVARGVLDGSIPTDKASAEFRARVGKIQTASLEGYEPDQRMVMEGHLTGTSGALQRSLGQVVEKRQRQNTAGFIDQFGEQVSREASRQGPQWATQKFGAMVDFSGAAAGLNPEQQAKLKQSFSERVHATFFESAGNAALQNGDADALGALVQKVNGPEGDVMDPTRRVQLSHQLFGWQQSILAARRRDQNRADDEARIRYNEAADAYNKATDIALGGGYLSPEFITELTTKATGTEMAKPVQDLIASQQTIAGFASNSAPARAALLERMRSARATPGQGTDPAGDRLLAAMKTMDDRLNEAAKDNPWQAAQQAGVIRDAPAFVAGDPSAIAAIVQQRMQLIGRVESWAGHKVSPLQPAEVEQITKSVRALPLEQSASMLANLGGALGDPERIAAVGKQLHDKDGALGLAMMYASAKTTQGRYVAELVLRGDQAIRDKSVMIDKAAETGWQGAIAKQIRGVYQDRSVEDAAIEAAFKIAAAKYVDNGSADIPKAVELATGGIVERNGARVPLPWGMSERDFNRRVDSITAADLASQTGGQPVRVGGAQLPVDAFIASLKDARLAHGGQGRYLVRAGTGYVTNAQGAPIVLQVKP